MGGKLRGNVIFTKKAEIVKTSIGTVELRFQKHACIRSARNITTGEPCDNEPPREQIIETAKKRPRKMCFSLPGTQTYHTE